MSSYGFKISLPGYDVNTAEPHQCAVHSGYPCLKCWSTYRPANYEHPAGIYHYGTVNIVFNNNPPHATDTEIFRIQHDMGYTPSCLVRGKFVYGGNTIQGTLPIAPTATLEFYVMTDEDYFRVYAYRETGWGSIIGNTLTFNYMIFGDVGA